MYRYCTYSLFYLLFEEGFQDGEHSVKVKGLVYDMKALEAQREGLLKTKLYIYL